MSINIFSETIEQKPTLSTKEKLAKQGKKNKKK